MSDPVSQYSQRIDVLFSGSFEGMDFWGKVSRRTLDIGAWRLLRRHAPAESFDLPGKTLATIEAKQSRPRAGAWSTSRTYLHDAA
jgi:hypothetical protein